MPILQVSTRRPPVSCKRWPGRRCRTIIRSDFEFVRAGDYFDKILRGTGAFSSEVDTGSRQENASKQEIEPRSDSIGTEKALVLLRHKFIRTRRAVEARQHGHRGKRLTRASMMRRRTVAIEFGT